ncbi:MAG: DUF4824 family protein [Piscirickettsiaceae bacterium]|nr:DUF4824 family protein [Piscirickettsiaceae bacterium]
MKPLLSSRNLFIVSFLVLLATNAFVLTGVASNKAGTPGASVTLSERELSLPYRLYKENSGLSLTLQWRTLNKQDGFDSYSYTNRGTPAWFDSKKLEALGYSSHEIEYYSSSSYDSRKRKPLPKEVFIVLENNSALYDEALKRAEVMVENQKARLAKNANDKQIRGRLERAEKQLNRERLSASRLFAVDAGVELTALRQQYSDSTRFIIAKGLIEPNYSYNNNKENRKIHGYIRRLSIEKIHIPLIQRKLFDNFLGQNKTQRSDIKVPRYQVELAYGSRLEPWVVSVKPMSAK